MALIQGVLGESLWRLNERVYQGWNVSVGSPPDQRHRHPESLHLGVQLTKNPRMRKFEFERQLLEVKRLFPSGGPNSRF